MDIGSIIKKRRNELGLTQVELASNSNISRSYLADVEKNRYNASVETLRSIARALKIPMATLLCEDSYSLELLTAIQNAYSEKDNHSTSNAILLDFLSRELNIESDELFEVYNNKSSDLPLETQSILLNHLKTLAPKAYANFTNQYTVMLKEPEVVHNIDEDMNAIIEALKNASPNKKAKILKMIELFDDEN